MQEEEVMTPITFLLYGVVVVVKLLLFAVSRMTIAYWETLPPDWFVSVAVVPPPPTADQVDPSLLI